MELEIIHHQCDLFRICIKFICDPNTYNATEKAVSNAGSAVQKFTADNRTSLLATAKGLQDNGDKIAATGAVMAVMGAPVVGVGATPGVTVADLRKDYILDRIFNGSRSRGNCGKQ